MNLHSYFFSTAKHLDVLQVSKIHDGEKFAEMKMPSGLLIRCGVGKYNLIVIVMSVWKL
jgi:hypothetical protein